MTLSGLLKSAATATTNPDPNSLTTPNPYPTPYVHSRSVSSGWTTQAATNCKALFHRGGSDGNGLRPLQIAFTPSGGGAVTYTVTPWYFNKLSGKWHKPDDNAAMNLTGYAAIRLENLDQVPVFLQLSSISAGNIDIHFDNGTAEAL